MGMFCRRKLNANPAGIRKVSELWHGDHMPNDVVRESMNFKTDGYDTGCQQPAGGTEGFALPGT
jgi:hypothetical protein